jgi:hypothetical protein
LISAMLMHFLCDFSCVFVLSEEQTE